MTPIKIPDICKPGLDITLGYSGGMALYIADWHSFNYLFRPMPFVKTALWAIKLKDNSN